MWWYLELGPLGGDSVEIKSWEWSHHDLLLFGCSVVSDSSTPWTTARQASLSFTSSGVCTDSCPWNQWCYPTLSSSIVSFSCPQSFPASASFPTSQLFASGSQSIGASASELVPPLSIFLFFFGGASLVAQMVKNLSAMQETWVWSLGWEDPLEKEWLPTPVFLPRESHGQRSLADCSPWGRKESDTTEWLTLKEISIYV